MGYDMIHPKNSMTRIETKQTNKIPSINRNKSQNDEEPKWLDMLLYDQTLWGNAGLCNDTTSYDKTRQDVHFIRNGIRKIWRSDGIIRFNSIYDNNIPWHSIPSHVISDHKIICFDRLMYYIIQIIYHSVSCYSISFDISHMSIMSYRYVILFLPYHYKPKQAMSFHTKANHVISYHTKANHVFSYHIIPCHTMSYHTMPEQAMPFYITSLTISYQTIAYHTIHRKRMP